jgi:hypothetical protein
MYEMDIKNGEIEFITNQSMTSSLGYVILGTKSEPKVINEITLLKKDILFTEFMSEVDTDKCISIIRSSKSEEEGGKRLSASFNIDIKMAQRVMSLRLGTLTGNDWSLATKRLKSYLVFLETEAV